MSNKDFFVQGNKLIEQLESDINEWRNKIGSRLRSPQCNDMFFGAKAEVLRHARNDAPDLVVRPAHSITSLRAGEWRG